MTYKLRTREILESDIGVECPFMPDDGEYEIYFRALVEDIKNLDVVLNATSEDGTVLIELNAESDFNEFHANVKSILQSDISTKLKTMGFESVQ